MFTLGDAKLLANWTVVTLSIAFLFVYVFIVTLVVLLRLRYRLTWLAHVGAVATFLSLLATADLRLRSVAKETPIVLLLDASYSMRAYGADGERFVRQQRFAVELVRQLPKNTRLGVLSFAERVTQHTDGLRSPDEAVRAINAIAAADAPTGTILWDALLSGLTWAESQAPEGLLLLFSDGLGTEGDATLLHVKESRWRVCTVLVGHPEGEHVIWEGVEYPLDVDVLPLMWLSGHFNCPGFPLEADRYTPGRMLRERLQPMLDTMDGAETIALAPYLLLMAYGVLYAGIATHLLRRRTLM